MKKGSQAVEAAGEIHTDFATKFIKAEIYTFDDAMNNKEKINELKTMGLVKMVGRDYIMQEGDIAYFIKGQWVIKNLKLALLAQGTWANTTLNIYQNTAI